MNRNRWAVFSMIAGVLIVGLIVGIRAKQRMAAQSREQSMMLSEAPAMPAAQAIAQTAPLTIVPAQATTAAAVATPAAGAQLPATSGEIGGPIEIQTALANAGFYTGTIDGKAGPKTQQAIKDFQGAHGLTADGRVGSKTWLALKPFLSAQQSAPSSQPAQ